MDRWNKVHELSNTYAGVRHGTSEANAARIISSDVKLGSVTHSLTGEGALEVARTARKLKGKIRDRQIIIISSPFLRCRQTADILRAEISLRAPIVLEGARERWFGSLDKMSVRNYKEVWERDEKDPTHTKHGVESVVAVYRRMTGLVMALEKSYSRSHIIIVSHGDALQILATAFRRSDPALHRQQDHWERGEYRTFKLHKFRAPRAP